MPSNVKPTLRSMPTLSPWMLAGLGVLTGASAQAVPLSFNSTAYTYGYVNTSYASQYLGNVSFSIQGNSDYQTLQPGNSIVTSTATYSIAPGQPAGVDPVYDIVTSNGSYGFGYTGTSSVDATSLHSKTSTSQVDAGLNPVDQAGNSSVYAYSNASWNQQFYLAPTATHAAGSYGAILVGITMDGSFPASNYASTTLYASSSFTDTAGVSYTSSFYDSASSNDANWAGSSTTYKKLLFQYGTVFNLNTYLQTYASNNGEADFSNTGKISSIEIPFGAALESGAEQAGLGSNAALYGAVFQSSSPTSENTNWDFGNNGGGFTPNVPEPGTWAMYFAGLAAIGFMVRRRRS